MERWTGRVVLVTGASAGIGAAICYALAESGMKVVGAARSVDKLKLLAESIKDAKGSFTGVQCDLTKEEDINRLFSEIKTKFGGVDICINNAGLSYSKKFLDTTTEEWREMINVNIIALCLCTKLSITSMIERGVDDGHIININSISGHVVTSSSSSKFYASTKFAGRAITEGLRQEMRDLKSNIRISSISPGIVETEFAARMYGGNEEKVKKLYSSLATLKSEDIAATVLHIISSPSHVEINDVIIRPTEQTF